MQPKLTLILHCEKNGYDYVASPFLKLDFVKLSNKKSLDQLIIV